MGAGCCEGTGPARRRLGSKRRAPCCPGPRPTWLMDAHAAPCRPLDLRASSPPTKSRAHSDPAPGPRSGGSGVQSSPAPCPCLPVGRPVMQHTGQLQNAPPRESRGSLAAPLVPSRDNAPADVTCPVHPRRGEARWADRMTRSRSCAPERQREPAFATRGGAACRGCRPCSRGVYGQGTRMLREVTWVGERAGSSDGPRGNLTQAPWRWEGRGWIAAEGAWGQGTSRGSRKAGGRVRTGTEGLGVGS